MALVANGTIWTSLRDFLPRGIPLPGDQWARRHRAIVTVLWLHAAGLALFAAVRGNGVVHSLFGGSIVAVFAVLGTQPAGGRRLRAVATAAGLVASSAVLVHLSGGVVEMHFHFFVIVGVITLYQDWTVFLTAIVFIALHHGVVGGLQPNDVYNHAAAWNNPWKWAGIHGAFILAASAAQITSWRFTEDQFRRSEAQLLARDRRFRSLIENSSDGISIIGRDGSLIYDSPSVSSILGYDAGERRGTNVFDFIHPRDIAPFSVIFQDMVEGRLAGTLALELRAQHQDGSWRCLEARMRNLLETPDVGGIVANYRDVTERRALEERLAHRAFHDPLTELPNRALFLDRIEHAIATHFRTPDHLAVLFIDLDDFKTVNDALGHAAGDHVLRTVGQRLTGCVRGADTCARLGGDEFGVLLEGLAGPATAYEVGARILEALGDNLFIQGSRITLNASLGIVVSNGTEDAASLVRNADLAMYRAKSEGKGRYEIYEVGMHDAVVERLALKADLRRGVDAGQFVAHYQPIVELSTGRVVGGEALVRWEHPERGLLSPATFLEVAEEMGVMPAIGSAVLSQACRDAARWSSENGEPRTVSVNLSASQLKQDGIVGEVIAVLAETGLPPASLTIEITETLLMEDPERAAATLRRLSALGVKIALDDFGTGYSSLSYLNRFPVDQLKIDKSFVDALAGAGAATEASLVGAIAGIGKMLSLEVTAEGVEHHSQLVELLSLGCKFGQGYYYAKPVPNREFTRLLTKHFEASPVIAAVPASWAEGSTTGT
ncbi:MAG: EAL domain-containing protein [Actinomycetota bacterium]|nr:EAL domain-containing protein [Actinomycetota bacterium]